MRMILVHGINQHGKSASRIRDDWLDALHASYTRQGPDPLASCRASRRVLRRHARTAQLGQGHSQAMHWARKKRQTTSTSSRSMR